MKTTNDVSKHPGIQQIRQIQQLMLLCALLPPRGKLREALALALAVDEAPMRSRVSPVQDLEPLAAKAWFESIWANSNLSAQEKEVVDWQNNADNIATAVQELQSIERQTGMSLVAQIR